MTDNKLRDMFKNHQELCVHTTYIFLDSVSRPLLVSSLGGKQEVHGSQTYAASIYAYCPLSTCLLQIQNVASMFYWSEKMLFVHIIEDRMLSKRS